MQKLVTKEGSGPLDTSLSFNFEIMQKVCVAREGWMYFNCVRHKAQANL